MNAIGMPNKLGKSMASVTIETVTERGREEWSMSICGVDTGRDSRTYLTKPNREKHFPLFS